MQRAGEIYIEAALTLSTIMVYLEHEKVPRFYE
jgi:hypothetical protein